MYNPVFQVRIWPGLLVGLTVLYCVSAVADSTTNTPEVQSSKDFFGGLYRSGQIYLAGQPLTAEAIEKLKTAGVATIVNLRTPKEISDPEKSPLDEKAVSQGFGLEYFHIPAGGEDHPFTAAQVNQFAQIARDAPGDILLHCASGRRATHLWVAWLVTSKGVPLDEAIRMGRKANLGSTPFEGFLGGEVEYQYTGQSSPASP